MPTLTLRLYTDVLPAKALLAPLAAGLRILYVDAGAVTIRAGGQTTTLSPNSAWHAASGCEISAGPQGATIQRFELVGTHAPQTEVAGPDVRSTLTLARDVTVGWPEGALLRCDRVDFPLGGIAYTHVHQGPGIRLLLRGHIRVEAAGEVHEVEPGHAWFESGPDPVLALASKEALTSFVRVMVLPRGLVGKSSIRYVKPEDADKPKTQRYQMFVDEPIELPNCRIVTTDP